MIRLVIADDHAIFRGGLKRLFELTSDIAVTAQACNGGEVLQCLQHESFDLLLLDMNMPGITGVDLIARVRAHRANLPILVLSMHSEAKVAARALKAGANGYITKDCEPETLFAAIRKLASGGQYIDPVVAEKIVFDITSTLQQPPHFRLSQRELEVFRLLAQGLAVNEIATQLAISGKTVSTHKLRFMEKLNLPNMAELMRYAVEHDLLD